MDPHFPGYKPEGKTSGKRLEAGARLMEMEDDLQTLDKKFAAEKEIRLEDFHRARQDAIQAEQNRQVMNQEINAWYPFKRVAEASCEVATRAATDDYTTVVHQVIDMVKTGNEKMGRLEKENQKLRADLASTQNDERLHQLEVAKQLIWDDLRMATAERDLYSRQVRDSSKQYSKELDTLGTTMARVGPTAAGMLPPSSTRFPDLGVGRVTTMNRGPTALLAQSAVEEVESLRSQLSGKDEEIRSLKRENENLYHMVQSLSQRNQLKSLEIPPPAPSPLASSIEWPDLKISGITMMEKGPAVMLAESAIEQLKVKEKELETHTSTATKERESLEGEYDQLVQLVPEIRNVPPTMSITPDKLRPPVTIPVLGNIETDLKVLPITPMHSFTGILAGDAIALLNIRDAEIETLNDTIDDDRKKFKALQEQFQTLQKEHDTLCQLAQSGQLARPPILPRTTMETPVSNLSDMSVPEVIPKINYFDPGAAYRDALLEAQQAGERDLSIQRAFITGLIDLCQSLAKYIAGRHDLKITKEDIDTLLAETALSVDNMLSTVSKPFPTDFGVAGLQDPGALQTLKQVTATLKTRAVDLEALMNARSTGQVDLASSLSSVNRLRSPPNMPTSLTIRPVLQESPVAGFVDEMRKEQVKGFHLARLLEDSATNSLDTLAATGETLPAAILAARHTAEALDVFSKIDVNAVAPVGTVARYANFSTPVYRILVDELNGMVARANSLCDIIDVLKRKLEEVDRFRIG